MPFAQGVCQDDSHSLAHYLLGEAYLRENNLQSAASEFREALNRDLDQPWTVVWSHIQLAGIFDVRRQHESERELGRKRWRKAGWWLRWAV